MEFKRSVSTLNERILALAVPRVSGDTGPNEKKKC